MDIDSFSEEELVEIQMRVNRKLQRMQTERLNFVDLFCGAGGLSCGLEMAGLRCLLGVDHDAHAMKTFKNNHPYAQTFCGPIAELSEEQLQEKLQGQKVHLLAGGPPCQGFSTIGEGNPDDEKNSLFMEYCRILKILKPDYILFENVTGLLAKKNERILMAIIGQFRLLGYEVKVKILESQKFGVPQIRKRTVLLGTNKDRPLSYPAEKFDTTIDEKYIPPTNIGDTLKALQEETQLHNHDLSLTNILVEKNLERLKLIPEGKGIRYKQDEDEFLPDHLKLDVDWKKLKEHRLRELRFHRLDRKLPAPTINTKNGQYFHPTENRRFTVRELASFQSFPPHFIFHGPHRSQMVQVGNAVPPLLAKALGQEIVKANFSDKSAPQEEYIPEHELLQSIRKKAFIYQERKKSDRNNEESLYGVQMPLIDLEWWFKQEEGLDSNILN